VRDYFNCSIEKLSSEIAPKLTRVKHGAFSSQAHTTAVVVGVVVNSNYRTASHWRLWLEVATAQTFLISRSIVNIDERLSAVNNVLRATGKVDLVTLDGSTISPEILYCPGFELPLKLYPQILRAAGGWLESSEIVVDSGCAAPPTEILCSKAMALKHRHILKRCLL